MPKRHRAAAAAEPGPQQMLITQFQHPMMGMGMMHHPGMSPMMPPHHMMMPPGTMPGIMPPASCTAAGPGASPAPDTPAASPGTSTAPATALDESTSEEEEEPRAKKSMKAKFAQKKWHQGPITSSSTFVGKICTPRVCCILEWIDPRYTASSTAEISQEQAAVMLWFDPSLEYKPPSEAPHVFDAF